MLLSFKICWEEEKLMHMVTYDILIHVIMIKPYIFIWYDSNIISYIVLCIWEITRPTLQTMHPANSWLLVSFYLKNSKQEALVLEEPRKATKKPAAVVTHDINILAFRHMQMLSSQGFTARIHSWKELKK